MLLAQGLYNHLKLNLMSNITEKVKQIVEYEKDIATGIEEIKQFLIHPDTQQAELPPKHSFSPGIYVRELAIPEGTLLIGKIHKHRHVNEDDGQDIKVIEDRIVVEEKSQYLEYKKKLTKKLST